MLEKAVRRGMAMRDVCDCGAGVRKVTGTGMLFDCGTWGVNDGRVVLHSDCLRVQLDEMEARLAEYGEVEPGTDDTCVCGAGVRRTTDRGRLFDCGSYRVRSGGRDVEGRECLRTRLARAEERLAETVQLSLDLWR